MEKEKELVTIPMGGVEYEFDMKTGRCVSAKLDESAYDIDGISSITVDSVTPEIDIDAIRDKVFTTDRTIVSSRIEPFVVTTHDPVDLSDIVSKNTMDKTIKDALDDAAKKTSKETDDKIVDSSEITLFAAQKAVYENIMRAIDKASDAAQGSMPSVNVSLPGGGSFDVGQLLKKCVDIFAHQLIVFMSDHLSETDYQLKRISEQAKLGRASGKQVASRKVF